MTRVILPNYFTKEHNEAMLALVNKLDGVKVEKSFTVEDDSAELGAEKGDTVIEFVEADETAVKIFEALYKCDALTFRND